MDDFTDTPTYEHFHGTNGPYDDGHHHLHPHPPQPPCPDQHDPTYWANEGRWPMPPSSVHPSPPQPCPAPPCPPTCSPVPPPVPPVRYVPGMDVQEQLAGMAKHVNTCIDRWNQIQANCFDALNRVVGAAVSNDVYYEPDEVRLSSGYSSADGAPYHIIEARPVSKAGHPIRLQLMTAYNAGQPSVREPMLDKSFVSSANAIITAVNPSNQWRGLCLVNGNPQATNEPQEGDWLCGWTQSGVLRVLPAADTSVESARRNQLTSCIGPVIPIVEHGKPTAIAAEFSAEPGAIQAIGWKQCNGNKVLFSCGFNEEPGCTVKNVADLLCGMGVTTAVVTCYMNAYGAPTTQADDSPADSNSLGLTGGMAYIGSITERPLEFQLPANSAFWVISKRPGPGWNNRFTGEIADICQRLGQNATELSSLQGKIDLEQKQILDLLSRVAKNEVNIKDLQTLTATHTTQITGLTSRITAAENNISNLQLDLSAETKNRINADTELWAALNKETAERTAADSTEQQQRIDADNKLSNDINLIRTALTEEITARNQADTDLNNAIRNEINARMAADTALQSQIELLKTQTNTALQKEIQDRLSGDDKLQEQIDELQAEAAKEYAAGKGLSAAVSGDTTTFNVTPGPGIRINAANQVAVNTGKGIENVNGRVQLAISDCFDFNEKGELIMSCCNTSGEPQVAAGVGLDYAADPDTGKLSMNLQPPADGQIGGVKAGAGVTIAADGTISANGGGGGESEPYTLPAATETTLGGVIVGDNLTVDSIGKVSAPAPYELPVASADTVGGVRVGTNLTIDQNGVLNASIPDMPGREGDTVLAGDGIDVTKDGETGTATVALNQETQDAITQIGENKDAIDSIKSDVRALSQNKADRDDVTAVEGSVSDLEGEISALKTQVDTHTQAIADAAETASKAQTDANAASTAAQAAQTAAEQAATDATAAKTAADEKLPLTGGTVTGNITISETGNANALFIKNDGNGTRSPIIALQPNGTPGAVVLRKSTDGSVQFYTDTSYTNTAENNRIRLNGIATPEQPADAVNKEYVDSTTLPVAGGTMTGTLNLTNPKGTLERSGAVQFRRNTTTRDSAIFITQDNVGYVQIYAAPNNSAASNGTLLRGIASPSNGFDAANKEYVDTSIPNLIELSVQFTTNSMTFNTAGLSAASTNISGLHFIKYGAIKLFRFNYVDAVKTTGTIAANGDISFTISATVSSFVPADEVSITFPIQLIATNNTSVIGRGYALMKKVVNSEISIAVNAKAIVSITSGATIAIAGNCQYT